MPLAFIEERLLSNNALYTLELEYRLLVLFSMHIVLFLVVVTVIGIDKL